MKNILLILAISLFSSLALANGSSICSSEQKQRGCQAAGKGCKEVCDWESREDCSGGNYECFPDGRGGETCTRIPHCTTEWDYVCRTQCKSYYCSCKNRRKKRRIAQDSDFLKVIHKWEAEDQKHLE